MSEVRDVLTDARNLIADPAKWGKGPQDWRPGTYCAEEAIEHVTTDGIFRTAARAAVAAMSGRMYAHDFNDDPDTTHADVLAAFDRAIAEAEAEADR